MILSTEIRFEDPPPPCRSYPRAPEIDWTQVAAQLTRQPGVWARILLVDSSGSAAGIAQRIRDGRVETLAVRGRFDAKARRIRNEYRVYAVFQGRA